MTNLNDINAIDILAICKFVTDMELAVILVFLIDFQLAHEVSVPAEAKIINLVQKWKRNV